ncbi:MAG: protein kinase, partial [Verrucomicrobia bacterium]|nr:protein kinase [Verrucomicrobiota bacterium]
MNTSQANPAMPNGNTCPQCGAALPAGALAGLCPACLLKQGAAADTAPLPGAAPFTPLSVAEVAKLFPQLEILSLIGQGGMGAVYKARQKQLDRIVALKILPPAVSHDPKFAERFAREAKALARLNHPNIVTLYEFGQADGLFYFLMEFMDGMNLRQLLNAGRVTPKEALAIVPPICDALQFAHDRGIVHRDIKPENILLSKAGQVKIADFGVAKIVASEPATTATSGAVAPPSAQTDAGLVMGTPQYMAPEQTEHPAEVDHRADIYSLGVVFYQMLTGELPKGKFEAPSKKVVIDVRLDEVVLRALEKEPERRYQQVSEVKTQVETIAGTPPQVAPVKSTPLFDFTLKLFTFTSQTALNVARVGWILGCLAALGFMPGLEWMFSFSGCFGLIGLAVLIELVHRRRHGIPMGTQIGTSLFPHSFGYTFTSQTALRIARVGWNFGCLGALGLLGFIPGVPWLKGLFGLSGFFGLIGLAVLIEGVYRSQHGIPIGTQKNAREAHALRETAPRFSRTAIVGAVWAAFALLATVQSLLEARGVVLPADSSPPGNGKWLWVLLRLAPALGYTASLGTTILGWISVKQIRRSAGKLRGLRLAVFDGLLFPLLALDGFIHGLISVSLAPFAKEWINQHGLYDSYWNDVVPLAIILLSFGLIAITDYWIIRWAWRKARKTDGGTGVPPVTSTSPQAEMPVPPSYERDARATQPPRFSRTAIVGALWLLVNPVTAAVCAMATPYNTEPITDGPVRWVLNIFSYIFLALSALCPIGTTILGCVALSQIRRSAGKLYGLGLALFDALLFPLLALDVIILRLGGGWDQLLTNIQWGLMPVLIVCVLSNVVIIRWAWRKARKADGGAGVPPAEPDVATRITKQGLHFFDFTASLPLFVEHAGQRSLYGLGVRLFCGTLGLAVFGTNLAFALALWLLTAQAWFQPHELAWVLFWMLACASMRWAALKRGAGDVTRAGSAPAAKVSTARRVIVGFLAFAVTMALAAGVAFFTKWMRAVSTAELANIARVAAWIAIAVAVGWFIIHRVWRKVDRSAEDTSRPAGYFKRRLMRLPALFALLVTFTLIMHTFFLGNFSAATDAAAPEIPRGSRFFVWKLSHNFAPGDLIAYRQEGQVNVGRVVRGEDGSLIVNRNGKADAAVPHADIVGKVVTIYWRASADMIVTGTVTDAVTGKPIAGARVDDSRYGADANRVPQQAWTDAEGHFTLTTWPEEHSVAASAPGYEPKLATLVTSFWGLERAARMDFQLQRTNAVTALTFGPVITRAEVGASSALIEGRGAPDAKFVLQVGKGSFKFFLNDSPFTATIERAWWGRGLNFFTKDSRGNVLLNARGNKVGPMIEHQRGQIIFRKGTLAPEPDGSFILG